MFCYNSPLCGCVSQNSFSSPRDDDGGRCGSASDNTNSTAYRLQQRTQAEAARFNLYMDIVTDVPGFVVLLFFGKSNVLHVLVSI